jgi:prepilin-type N-terminal cleavage/methylation domain-containing protein
MNNKKISAFSLIELSIVILIIGILVAGITQSSRLVAQFRLSSAKSLTRNSPVSSIKDLVFWFEATSDASFDDAQEEEGTAVTTWYDINPQLSQKSNATSATAPTYKANCINGLPCLNFNGTTQYLEVLQNNGTLTQITAIFVINDLVLTPLFTNQYMISAFTSGISSLQFYTGGGLNASYLNQAESGGVGHGYGLGVVAQNDAIVGITDTGALQTIYFTLPGSAIDNRQATNSTGRKYLNNGIGIGAHYNGTARSGFFNGYISEVIVFSRVLKAEERNEVLQYLSKKWGIRI